MSTADPYSTAGLLAFDLWSGMQQADMIKDNAATMGLIYQINSEFAEVDAYEAVRAGNSNANRVQSVVDKVHSEQTAALAGRGQDVNFGSAAELKGEATIQGLVQQAEIKNEARNQALGIKREALNLRTQGTLNQYGANTRASAQVGATILSGLGSAVKAYTRGKTQNDYTGSDTSYSEDLS